MKIRYTLYSLLCIFVGILLVMVPSSHAGTNDFERLRKESANIKTIQSGFTQKNHENLN